MLVLLAACSTADSRGTPTPPATPTPGKDATTMPTTIWKPHAIAAYHLTIDLIDGLPIDEGDIAALQRHYLMQRRDISLASVWVGGDASLDAWRKALPPTKPVLSAETTVRLCGRPAMRQEAIVPADAATGAVSTPTGIGHIEHKQSARVRIAVAGTMANGTGFLVGWDVDTDQRDALRPEEDHFFASVRCD